MVVNEVVALLLNHILDLFFELCVASFTLCLWKNCVFHYFLLFKDLPFGWLFYEFLIAKTFPVPQVWVGRAIADYE